jgi:hypothetical protein
MSMMGVLEALSYAVTILGFPIGIYVFVVQQRRARQHEESALHRNLSEEYDGFLRLALDNADLQLMRGGAAQKELTVEQRERQLILFRILVSVFEKAFIILHSERMSPDTRRMWLSWEDDMREWCARPEFRAQLEPLLEGEDDQFSRHIRAIAADEAAKRERRQAAPEELPAPAS